MDTQNPYAVPETELDVQRFDFEAPADIKSQIFAGFVCILISLTMTAIMALMTLSTDFGIFDEWLFVDVVFLIVLAFGIYKKSRTAATVMFIYFVAGKIYLTVETGAFSGLIIGAIFAFFYFRAMMACFTYHKLLNAHDAFFEMKNT
jgi:hypothetical protein